LFFFDEFLRLTQSENKFKNHLTFRLIAFDKFWNQDSQMIKELEQLSLFISEHMRHILGYIK